MMRDIEAHDKMEVIRGEVLNGTKGFGDAMRELETIGFGTHTAINMAMEWSMRHSRDRMEKQ